MKKYKFKDTSVNSVDPIQPSFDSAQALRTTLRPVPLVRERDMDSPMARREANPTPAPPLLPWLVPIWTTLSNYGKLGFTN